MTGTDVGGAFGEPRPPETSGNSPKQMAEDAAQVVKREAASFAEGAREKAVENIDQQTEAAGRTLGDFANAVRRAGDELARSDQSMAIHLVRQAADGLEGFARSLTDKRPEEMLQAVREFGRRNPTAFIAGSVLAGVAIGRFLRSSSPSSQAADVSGSAVAFAGPQVHEDFIVRTETAGGSATGVEEPVTPEPAGTDLRFGAPGGGPPQPDEGPGGRFGPGS